MVTNAVSEMRRYYSRKVIDVLIKVTRSSLDVLRRVFSQDMGNFLDMEENFSFRLCKFQIFFQTLIQQPYSLQENQCFFCIQL